MSQSRRAPNPPRASDSTSSAPGVTTARAAAPYTPPGGRPETGRALPVTACYPCRNARQRCDKKVPCSRCCSHQFQCQYPARSYRGRKQGSTNKPTNLRKLLSRVVDSDLEEELTNALLSRRRDKQSMREHTPSHSEDSEREQQDPENSSPVARQPWSGYGSLQHQPTPIAQTSVSHPDISVNNSATASHTARPPNAGYDAAGMPRADDATPGSDPGASEEYSPLQILAAAVGAETLRHGVKQTGDTDSVTKAVPRPRGHQGRTASSTADTGGFQRNRAVLLADSKLARYFAARDVDFRDWDVMGKTSPDSAFRLDPEVCDPVAAGLVSEQEVMGYFKLFFEVRNPLVGLLDPDLHTPEYVHGCSFTLFSVICALGSELSSRSRDVLLSPLLYSMAERNIKWSILSAVKTLETIQAIITHTYWSHVSENYAEDHSWLRFGHALSIARELRIYQPSFIMKKVENFNAYDPIVRERQIRNFQRTWLFIFIMDKSFGITLGRAPCVSWREVPSDISNWACNPSGTSCDRTTTGLIEMRVALLKDLERLRSMEKTPASINEWHERASCKLEDLRADRCAGDDGAWLPILAFYIDHSLLLVHANAHKELGQLERCDPEELEGILLKTFKVGSRFIRLFVHDPLLVSMATGVHNTQFVMISHAATEVLRVSGLRCGTLYLQNALTNSTKALRCKAITEDSRQETVALLRATAEHVNRIANALPSTSWASLHLEYIHFLVRRLNEETTAQVFNSSSNLPLQSERQGGFDVEPGSGGEDPAGAMGFMPSMGYWDIDHGNVPGAGDMLPGALLGLDPIGLEIPQMAVYGTEFGL